MAEYIEREALVDVLREHIEAPNFSFTDTANNLINTGLRIAVREAKNAPTADVVPRAEVEALQNTLSKTDEYLERIKKLFEEESQTTKKAFEIINEWEAQYKTAKQEVAKEIFAEIDKLHIRVTNGFDAMNYEKLKNKYIGGVE